MTLTTFHGLHEENDSLHSLWSAHAVHKHRDVFPLLMSGHSQLHSSREMLRRPTESLSYAYTHTHIYVYVCIWYTRTYSFKHDVLEVVEHLLKHTVRLRGRHPSTVYTQTRSLYIVRASRGMPQALGSWLSLHYTRYISMLSHTQKRASKATPK
jgi:hypothetical protein